MLERKHDPGEKLRTTGIIVKEAAEHTLLNQIPAAMTRRIEEVRLDHGWTVGRAIAAHLRDGARAPERIAIECAPRFRAKRALRWAYDRLQFDWPFDLLLHSPPLRWAAEQVYFHKRRC